MLTTVTYTVPALDPANSNPVTVVHLRPTVVAGQIQVFLNSDTTRDYFFTGTSDKDQINASFTGLTIINHVSGAFQPTGGMGFIGGGGSTTLQIVGGANDTLIEKDLTASTSTTTVIKLTDATDSVVVSDSYGSGIDNLTIDTSTSGGTDVKVANLTQHLTVNSNGTYDKIELGASGNEGTSVVDAVVNTGAGNDEVDLSSGDRRRAGHRHRQLRQRPNGLHHRAGLGEHPET